MSPLDGQPLLRQRTENRVGGADRALELPPLVIQSRYYQRHPLVLGDAQKMVAAMLGGALVEVPTREDIQSGRY